MRVAPLRRLHLHEVICEFSYGHGLHEYDGGCPARYDLLAEFGFVSSIPTGNEFLFHMFSGMLMFVGSDDFRPESVVGCTAGMREADGFSISWMVLVMGERVREQPVQDG